MELRYIQKDAHEAGRNAHEMGDQRGVNKYADQVNDASTVLAYRRAGGKSDAPSDVLDSGTAKSNPAPIHNSMRGPGQSDASYITQRLTANADKSVGMERQPGESDASYIRRRIE